MRGTLLVARAELGRMCRLRSSLILGFLVALLAALRAFVGIGAATAERGGADDPISSGGGWAPLVDGWSAGLLLGTLFLLTHAARSIAGDRESGVLRLAITRSVSRGGLIWGRLLVSPLLVLLVVLLPGLAAYAVVALGSDFGPLVEDGYEIFTAEELGGELRRGVLAILPGLLATYAFGLLVSSFASTATTAVASALGLFLAFDLFKEALGDSHYWVFASHVPTPWDTSAWSELPGVMRGFSDAGFPEALVRVGWAVAFPAALLCAAVACLVLARRRL